MGDGPPLDCALANVRMRERNNERMNGFDQYTLAKELYELNTAVMVVLRAMGDVSVPMRVAEALSNLNLRTKRIWEAGGYEPTKPPTRPSASGGTP